MLHSSKAKEIATIKVIEDKIRDAALKGSFQISIGELSSDAETILRDNGYSITRLASNGLFRYDIDWN